jgi:hypothetical protein
VVRRENDTRAAQPPSVITIVDLLTVCQLPLIFKNRRKVHFEI